MEASSIADRARRTAVEDPQESMFDNVIEHELLEKALEKREIAREKLKPVKKAADEADDQAKALISALELEPDTVTRVGRFRIKTATVSGGHRDFDVADQVRTFISLLGE